MSILSKLRRAAALAVDSIHRTRSVTVRQPSTTLYLPASIELLENRTLLSISALGGFLSASAPVPPGLLAMPRHPDIAEPPLVQFRSPPAIDLAALGIAPDNSSSATATASPASDLLAQPAELTIIEITSPQDISNGSLHILSGQLYDIDGGSLMAQNSTITIDAGGELRLTAGSITLGGSSTLLANHGTLSLDGGSFTIGNSAVLANAGSLDLASSASFTLSDSYSTFYNAGSVHLGPNALMTINQGFLCSGYQCSAGDFAIDSTAALSLNYAGLYIGSGDWSNSGELDIEAGTLRVDSSINPGVLNFDAGNLQVAAGAALQDGNVQISYSQVSILGTMGEQATGSSLSFDGCSIKIAAGGSIENVGQPIGVTGNSLLAIDDGAALNIYGPLQLDNSTLQLNGSLDNWDSLQVLSGGYLLVGPTGIVHNQYCTYPAGGPSVTAAYNSMIELSSGASLISDGSLSVSGHLTVDAGASLQVNGALDVSGNLSNYGSLQINNGASSPITFPGGPVTIEGFFENAGSMQVNSSNIPVSNSGWLWNQGTLALSAASLDIQAGYLGDCYGATLELNANSSLSIHNAAGLYLTSDSTIALSATAQLSLLGAVNLDGTDLLPQMDGSPTITEADSYSLALSGGPDGNSIGPVTINPYSIDWGDGSTNDSSSTTHTFVSGTSSSQITLSVTTQATDTLPALRAVSEPLAVSILPASPYNLSATAVSPNEVDLSWSDTYSIADQFQIQRSSDGTTFTTLATINANSTGSGDYVYNDTSALDGRDYQYQVVALNSDGVNDPSDTVDAVTPVADPSSLTATALSGGTSIRLNWTDNSSFGASFEIDKQDDSGNWQYLDTATSPTYTDTGLSGLTLYAYRIQAYSDASASNWITTSQTTLLAPPAAPTNVAITVGSSTQLDVSWTNSPGAVNGYTLQESLDGNDWNNLTGTITSANGVSSESDTALTPGTKYVYQVIAANDAGSSDPSQMVYMSTPADTAAPVITSIVQGPTNAAGGGSVTLTWTYSGPANTFQVEDAETKYGSVDSGMNFAQAWSNGAPTASPHTFSATIPYMAAEDTYLFRVRAQRADGTVSPYATSAPFVMALGTPLSSLTAAAQSGSIHLTWNAPSGLDSSLSVSHYYMQYLADGQPDGLWQPYGGANGITGPSQTSMDASVNSGAYASFRVAALYSDGTGSGWAYSDSVQMPEPTYGVADSSGPSITATALSDSVMQFTWPSSSDDAHSDGGLLTLGTLGPDQTLGNYHQAVINKSDGLCIATVGGLIPGLQYQIGVHGVYTTTGDSGSNVYHDYFLSSQATATGAQLDGVFGLSAKYIPSLQGVQLYWGQYSNNENGFIVQRSVDNVNFTTIATAQADQDSYVDTTAGPDSVYWYRLAPKNAASDSDSSYLPTYTSSVRVDTPGVSVTIASSQLDPVGNPVIPLEYNPPASGTADSNLVPVTVNVPLEAERFGIATFSWASGIKLWADNQRTIQLGTLGMYGYSMSWDVTQKPASQTFYAEGFSDSSQIGDHPFILTSVLSLTAPESHPATNPTTTPSQSKPTTTLQTLISGDNNDDGFVNAKDDIAKSDLPVILNLDDQREGKGLFIHGLPVGSLASAELQKSGDGQIRIIGDVLDGAGHSHIMGAGDSEISLNVKGLYNGGQWVNAIGEKNGFITVTLIEHFAGGGSGQDVIKLRVVRADMIFRKGSKALAYLIHSSVTHGGIDTGDDKIFDLGGRGWEQLGEVKFYDLDVGASENKPTKKRLGFDGSYMPDRIRAKLFDNLRNNTLDLPTGPVPWNLFSSSKNFKTANCLEMAEMQWKRAIREVMAQLTDPVQIAAFASAYYSGGTVSDVVEGQEFAPDAGRFAAAAGLAQRFAEKEKPYIPNIWSYDPEPYQTDLLQTDPHPILIESLSIVTPASYLASALFKEIPY